MRPFVLLLGCLLAALPSGASAAGPLGRNGDPIRTSEYAIDLSTGVATGSGRVVGLGGAYVALAEGTEGLAHNPAAAGVRPLWSRTHFDYDLGLGLTFPGALRGTDYFNTGDRGTAAAAASQEGLGFVELAAIGQWGRLGLALGVTAQTWRISGRSDDGGTARRGAVEAEFVTGDALVAWGFADGQLVVGFGQRTTSLGVVIVGEQAAEGRTLVSAYGAAYQVGAVFKPHGHRFRLGAAVRSRVVAEPEGAAQGDVLAFAGTPDEVYVPRRAVLPEQVALGFALQLGPRPLNRRFVDEDRALGRLRRMAAFRERERERRARFAPAGTEADRREAERDRAEEARRDRRWVEQEERAFFAAEKAAYAREPRRYLLVSVAAVALGPVDDAVGVESFLNRRVHRSGELPSVSYRLGVEGEPVPHWWKVRLGTYYEPTRFREVPPPPGGGVAIRPRARQHATAGFDVRLFPWTVFGLFEDGTTWRAGAALDTAPRYFAWSASVGVWH